MRRLLLLSNSTSFGEGYLDHAMAAVLDHFAGANRIGFVPFALKDRAAYTAKARERFAQAGGEVVEVTADSAGAAVLDEVEGIFVGGGNTFRLLDTLDRAGLLEPLRRRALAGLPYLGASAGTNIAAPTIMTTNDMPIVEPRSFTGLGLVPFQINPHYIDPDASSRHMGETREARLAEYLEENDRVVVALREGAWLTVRGDEVVLGGRNGGRLFTRGGEAEELAPGAVLSGLGLGPVSAGTSLSDAGRRR